MGTNNLSKYQGYFNHYIALVSDQELLACLKEQGDSFRQFLEKLPMNEWPGPYAEGKWSFKELLGHMCDTERIMSYRALCYARSEHADQPPFDEDKYVANARFNELSTEQLITEFNAVRAATISLYSSFNVEELQREGNFSGARLSVEGIGYLMCGHLHHHLKIMKERYL